MAGSGSKLNIDKKRSVLSSETIKMMRNVGPQPSLWWTDVFVSIHITVTFLKVE